MIEYITSPDTFLYHYTTADKLVRHILSTRSLKLGRYIQTNDPKEAKTWSFTLATRRQAVPSAYDREALSSWLSSELKDKARILCCSRDLPPLTGDPIRDIFSRGFCKPRMWAQYADNHSGVCLILDKKALSASIKSQVISPRNTFEAPISYRDRSLGHNPTDPASQAFTINTDHLEAVGSDQYILDHLYTHRKPLFFEKMCDWEAESEWRFLSYSAGQEELYVSIETSLVGIVFGESATNATIDSIIELTSDLAIRYLRLKWVNSTPWYDFGDTRLLNGRPDRGYL